VTTLSRVATRLGKLPPVTSPDVVIERDLRIPMRDGVVLLADRYHHRSDRRLPTLLVRSCYGRRGIMGFQYGQLFAERGFQVLIQSIRGGYGSGGTFEPLTHDPQDGSATVAWLREQPWFTGQLGLVGASYLGYTQWATAQDPPPELGAMSVQMAPHDPVRTIYPGGAFALENWLTWAEDVTGKPWADTVLRASVEGAIAGRRAVSRLRPAYRQLPFTQAYRQALGHPAPFLEEWMAHPADGPYWQARAATSGVRNTRVPVGLLSGWYDAFLPDTLEAWRILREQGTPARLTVGGWAHSGLEDWPAMFLDAYSWLRAHLSGDPALLTPTPVRVFVLGAGGGWRDLPDWPPAGVTTQRWQLQPGGGLARSAPPTSEPDRFRYDPADPTPSVGGATLAGVDGPRDNRTLEARPDVLTYTSDPLEAVLELTGPVTATVHVEHELAHADVFVRLCDVAPDGRSTNICDGLTRLEPDPAASGAGAVNAGTGVQPVAVDLAATAYRVAAGHRLRVQVSGGAHPRWVRNYGTGEPFGPATQLAAGWHTVHHSPAHPSAIDLPIGSGD